MHDHHILAVDKPDVLVEESNENVRDLEEYFYVMTNGEVEEYV